jgi:succinate dehydrogenase subunit D
MDRQSNEAFFWTLFSTGGVVAALFIPAYLLLFYVAIPLGWIRGPSYEHLSQLFRIPLTRLFLVTMCSLSLFHWAHRFRYTLYDGLQVKHLNEVIFTLCYGSAVLGTVVAVYLAWNVA